MANYYPKPGDDVDCNLYNFNTSEKICKKHIDNEFIEEYIYKNSVYDVCSYCNKKLKVVDLSDILKLIVVGIDYLYEDPVNSRYINHDGEHGFDGDTFDFYDLWERLDLDIDDSNLSQDIFNYLENTSLYCNKNEFYSQEEDLNNLWNHFKEIVKHKARYVFYFKKTFSNYLLSDPIDILNEVQKTILELNLIKVLPLNTKLYRCRQHDSKTIIKDAENLASAPLEFAKTNGRMNPAGISMFYSSKSKELTIKEVVDSSDINKPYYSTGIFSTTENLNLVDLTKIPKYPSIYDEYSNRYIEIIAFLQSFINDISKPIDYKDSIIEYIPTQIVTEYIRFNPDLNVQGIIYPSSKDKKLNNIVLFFNHEESISKLNFNKSSIKKVKI